MPRVGLEKKITPPSHSGVGASKLGVDRTQKSGQHEAAARVKREHIFCKNTYRIPLHRMLGFHSIMVHGNPEFNSLEIRHGYWLKYIKTCRVAFSSLLAENLAENAPAATAWKISQPCIRVVLNR